MSLFGAYKKLSISLFGGIAEKSVGSFKQLKPYIAGSGLGMMLNTWTSIILFSTLLAYVSTLIVMSFLVIFVQLDIITMIYYVLFIPILSASLVFVLLYIFPIQKTNSIKNSIDKDLPFALAHMNAIASSGVPPEHLFTLLTDFKEYRQISKTAEIVVRNIQIFGMSSTMAIKNVAERTPSVMYKQVLDGIVSTIETGGNMVAYFKEMSDKALFDYRIKRENYLKMLSTYADMYTALLVAAPLMMMAVLGIMNLIGGQILGMTAPELIWLITWIFLPVLNSIFILFIHVTYPGV